MGERIKSVGSRGYKEHQETLVDDEDAGYLNCDDNFMSIYMCQNFFVHTLNKSVSLYLDKAVFKNEYSIKP